VIDLYEEIFQQEKEYVESNSKYNVRVVKNNTNTSSYFPIVVCQCSNMMDTDFCTIDKIEQHGELYISNDVFTQDKTVDNKKVASQLINDEITKLVVEFFNKINMKMTMCNLTPNLDKSIIRRTIRHQGLVSHDRKKITRRWKEYDK